jgi:hypothetical protein
MKMSSHLYKFSWCIVVADDHGPEWAPTVQFGERPSPVQYSRLGGSSTLLQRAMRRAARMASPSQVMITALERALSILPGVREGVVTLGMVDIDEGIDEDYLAVARARIGAGFNVLGLARRPASWTARLLVQQGAMIASGIMIGYAGAFAAHISTHWPGLAQTLAKLGAAAAATGSECEIPMNLQRGVPRPTMKSPRWNPPMFPQRAIPVMGSGWSGLRTQRAVGRVTTYSAIANTLAIQPLQDSNLVADQG